MQVTMLPAEQADQLCVPAPRDDHPLRPPMLLAVDVAEDEEVEWFWTHYIDGRSVVTGYRAVPKLPGSV